MTRVAAVLLAVGIYLIAWSAVLADRGAIGWSWLWVLLGGFCIGAHGAVTEFAARPPVRRCRVECPDCRFSGWVEK